MEVGAQELTVLKLDPFEGLRLFDFDGHVAFSKMSFAEAVISAPGAM